MSKIIHIKLEFDQDLDEYLGREFKSYIDYRIYSKSLDARGANRGKKPIYNYKIELLFEGEVFSSSLEKDKFENLGPLKEKPIIIGAGPAGLFCALRLSEYGIDGIVLERGDRAHHRMKKISKFWRHGNLDINSNVCFGEGGAGLFSDGKLITRIKSEHVQYVLNRFVAFGAPKETAYITNPHLGSNKIRVLINKITDFLKKKNYEFRYNTKVSSILFKDKNAIGVLLDNGEKIYSNNIILATGHSSKEMYFHLKDNDVAMKAKDFAVGVRVEHPRRYIDSIQYGEFTENHLGAARYKLTSHNKKTNRGAYSFCMCPGGYVLSSGTDIDGIVVNGMSNYARNSKWSNSALVVTVQSERDFQVNDVLNGYYFQRDIEKKAYLASMEYAGKKELPAQGLRDFLDNHLTTSLPKTSSPSGIFSYPLSKIFPDFIIRELYLCLKGFEVKMKGFIDNAILLAPETRTSAPVTILRNKDTLESISHAGLYPCGEGSGYAGGITSAAVDGVKVAMEILKKEKDFLN